MPPLRITLTEWAQITEAVGGLLPVHLISLICSWPRGTYLAFDLTRELRVACLIGNLNRIDELLDMGADPDATDGIGISALDIAHWLRRLITTTRLLAYLDIEEYGMTRLIQEISRGRSTVVLVLLGLGVREQLDEETYCEVLKVACVFGSLHVVNVLAVYAPRFLVSSYEELFVQAALLAHNTLIATYIRDFAAQERRRIYMDVSNYIISDVDMTPDSPTLSASLSHGDITPSASPSHGDTALSASPSHGDTILSAPSSHIDTTLSASPSHGDTFLSAPSSTTLSAPSSHRDTNISASPSQTEYASSEGSNNPFN